MLEKKQKAENLRIKKKIQPKKHTTLTKKFKKQKQKSKKESQFSSSSSEEEIPADDTRSDEVSDEELCLVCGVPGKDEAVLLYHCTGAPCAVYEHIQNVVG